MKFENTKIYEIEIFKNGENFFLTNAVRSPYLRSDIFGLSQYRRTTLTLIPQGGLTLKRATMSFAHQFTDQSRIGYFGEFSSSPSFEDFPSFEEKIVPKLTFFDKVRSFFGVKKEVPPEIKTLSHSFIYVKEGEKYHFWGSLNQHNGHISFEVDAVSGNIFCYSDSIGKEINQKEHTLFDIIKITGTKEEIFDIYFSAMKVTAHSAEKSLYPDIINIDLNSPNWQDTIKSINQYTLISLNGNVTVSDTIESSQMSMEIFSENENIIPTASISPFLIEDQSNEHTLFESTILKDNNGKPYIIQQFGKTYYVADVFDKAFQGYLKKQLGELVDMGYSSLIFNNLSCVSTYTRQGKTSGESTYFAYEMLSKYVGSDCLTFAKDCHVLSATDHFDFVSYGDEVTIEGEKPDLSALSSLAISHIFSKYCAQIMPPKIPTELLDICQEQFDMSTFLSSLLSSLNYIQGNNLSCNERILHLDVFKMAEIISVEILARDEYIINFNLDENLTSYYFNLSNASIESEDYFYPVDPK